MTTSQLITKLNDLAKIGIVNAKEDTAVLLEAVARLIELRAKACPKWNWGLIMDDGMFLESIDGDETNWTVHYVRYRCWNPTRNSPVGIVLYDYY